MNWYAIHTKPRQEGIAQTSLLRVIETKHLIRIGGQRVVAVDARVIATTRRCIG